MVSNHFLAPYYRSWLMKTYLINAFASVVLQRIIEFHLYPMNNSTFNCPYYSFQNQTSKSKTKLISLVSFPQQISPIVSITHPKQTSLTCTLMSWQFQHFFKYPAKLFKAKISLSWTLYFAQGSPSQTLRFSKKKNFFTAPPSHICGILKIFPQPQVLDFCDNFKSPIHSNEERNWISSSTDTSYERFKRNNFFIHA